MQQCKRTPIEERRKSTQTHIWGQNHLKLARSWRSCRTKPARRQRASLVQRSTLLAREISSPTNGLCVPSCAATIPRVLPPPFNERKIKRNTPVRKRWCKGNTACVNVCVTCAIPQVIHSPMRACSCRDRCCIAVGWALMARILRIIIIFPHVVRRFSTSPINGEAGSSISVRSSSSSLGFTSREILAPTRDTPCATRCLQVATRTPNVSKTRTLHARCVCSGCLTTVYA